MSSRKSRLAIAYTASVLLNGAFWLAYSHELRHRADTATLPKMESEAKAADKLKPLPIGIFHPLPPLPPRPAKATAARDETASAKSVAGDPAAGISTASLQGAALGLARLQLAARAAHERADRIGAHAAAAERTSARQARAARTAETVATHAAGELAADRDRVADARRDLAAAPAQNRPEQAAALASAEKSAASAKAAAAKSRSASATARASAAAARNTAATLASIAIAARQTAVEAQIAANAAQPMNPAAAPLNAAGRKAPSQVAAANVMAEGKTPGEDAGAPDSRPAPADKTRHKPASTITLRLVKMWAPKPNQKFNLATNLNIIFPKDMQVVPDTSQISLTDEQLRQITEMMSHQHLKQVTMNRQQVRQLAEMRRQATSKPHDPKDSKEEKDAADAAAAAERVREAKRRAAAAHRQQVARAPVPHPPHDPAATLQRPRSPFLVKMWDSDMYHRWAKPVQLAANNLPEKTTAPGQSPLLEPAVASVTNPAATSTKAARAGIGVQVASNGRPPAGGDATPAGGAAAATTGATPVGAAGTGIPPAGVGTLGAAAGVYGAANGNPPGGGNNPAPSGGAAAAASVAGTSGGAPQTVGGAVRGAGGSALQPGAVAGNNVPPSGQAGAIQPGAAVGGGGPAGENTQGGATPPAGGRQGGAVGTGNPGGGTPTIGGTQPGIGGTQPGGAVGAGGPAPGAQPGTGKGASPSGAETPPSVGTGQPGAAVGAGTPPAGGAGGGQPGGAVGAGAPPAGGTGQAGGAVGAGSPANGAGAGQPGAAVGAGTPGGGAGQPGGAVGAGGNQPGGAVGGGAPQTGGGQPGGTVAGGPAGGGNQPGAAPGAVGAAGGGQGNAAAGGGQPGGAVGAGSGPAAQGGAQTGGAAGATGAAGDAGAAGGGTGGGYASLGGEQSDGLDASQDGEPGEASQSGSAGDNGFTARENAESAELPPDPPGIGHTVPGSLVLPPSPPIGVEGGKDPDPHKIKMAMISLPSEKRTPTETRPESRVAHAPSPLARGTSREKMVKEPVGQPNKTGPKPVQFALTIGSVSGRGTIPMMVLSRPYLPMGTPSDTIDPPLLPAKGTPRSHLLLPARRAAVGGKQSTAVPETPPRFALTGDSESKKPARSVVLLARNSEGVKEGTEQPLPATPLPDSDMEVGDGSGLKGDYYQGPKFDQYQFSRADPEINFDWMKKPTQSPGPKIPAFTDYTARWTGRIAARFSETYTFYAAADDGVRVWINHKLIIDAWSAHSLKQFSSTYTFRAGEQYLFKCEYLEIDGGEASVYLYWSSPRTPKQFIPEDAFFYPLPSDEEALAKDKGTY